MSARSLARNRCRAIGRCAIRDSMQPITDTMSAGAKSKIQSVRIATWNLNSVKARLPRLLGWLEQRQPDVLLVQETKATDESWPARPLAELGYESVHHGTGRWNG